MSQPIKLPVIIAVVVAAIVVFGLIGYKLLGTSPPPVRTDAAARNMEASWAAKAQARKEAGGIGMTPPPSPAHP